MPKNIFLKGGYSYLSDHNVLINNELKALYIKHREAKKLADINITKQALQRNIRNSRQIIFEVTQDCNLRCKYCLFLSNYQYHRDVSKKFLDFETGKQGLSYIYDMIKDRERREIVLSFYGGEPLLKIDIIKKIVSFSKELFKDWDIQYVLTTNSTRLDSSVAKFLISEDFKISISLDGPKNIHDSKRVYTDGKGTYNDLMANLKRIKSMNNVFFKKNVRFSTVYSQDLSLLDTVDFFCNNEDVNQSRISLNAVNALHTDYYKRYPVNTREYKINLDKIIKNIIARTVNDDELYPVEIDITKNMLNITKLGQTPENILHGTCLFNNRLFIDTDGRFHICERINNSFSFGDVWNGIDFKKIKQIIDDFTKVKKNHCINCDIHFLCAPCYTAFAKGGCFEIDKDYCTSFRASILQILDDIILFKEKKHHPLNKKKKPKLDKFHQFVYLEKGPVNTAILDFLKGEIYQVENNTIKKFDDIKDFLRAAKEAGLIINVKANSWIPKDESRKNLFKFADEVSPMRYTLEIEAGVDLELIKERFRKSNVVRIVYYGEDKIKQLLPSVELIYKKRSFNECIEMSKINGEFSKTNESDYRFNQIYNSCWGQKIAVTKDGKIRPCIFSNIIIADLKSTPVSEIIMKAKNYWYFTKDKVEKCKECELRYVCFDCREVAQRSENGNLCATNPNCEYDPYNGSWISEVKKNESKIM